MLDISYHMSFITCHISFVSHVSCIMSGQLLPDPVGDPVPSLTPDVLAALFTAAASGPRGQRASLQE